jgi:hypothetical protein
VFPLKQYLGGRLGRLLGMVANGLARFWTTLFAFQLLVVCRARLGVKQRLLDSQILFSVPAHQTQEGKSPQASPVKETAHD